MKTYRVNYRVLKNFGFKFQDGDESETYILKETSKLNDYSEFLKFRNIKPAFSTVASFDFTSEEKALEAIEEFKKCNTNVIYMDGVEW